MSIAPFLAACDAFSAETGQSRRWLSKRLFSDTYRLERLEDGSIDVGVRRLERARADLALLVSEHSAASSSDDAVVAPGADHGAEKSLAVFSPAGGAA
ncbi:Uncharacterised protein [Brevundimonas vesicularis]|uniref:Uncharacterized protein n=1 Tax=Brevundimonas vesicularis TaxID=41276 RepID=A0A2X1BHM8_BREVE|nr:hypothetical protein [Brevundimonas vesicularis]SPU55898.1 Uncharacterised protein [Brevundimonas vesicularis]